jgi:hypothetical protein
MTRPISPNSHRISIEFNCLIGKEPLACQPLPTEEEAALQRVIAAVRAGDDAAVKLLQARS